VEAIKKSTQSLVFLRHQSIHISLIICRIPIKNSILLTLEEGDFLKDRLERAHETTMAAHFDNTYELTSEQLEQLDQAEEMMLRNDLGAAEKLLLSMIEADSACIPVLSNLGHLYGRHLSEFETAIEYYDKVLALEPDNAWARDARRRYLRYV
tara:strand:- start:1063 stop:1521 length:459 start_codon:yes stop_codon:yes gene_type:complete